MPLELYNGSDKIVDVYAGSQVISQIYKGSELVFTHYPVNGLVFEATTVGTHTFSPDVDGTYEIRVVGAGGGGATFADANKYQARSGTAGGGSGAYVSALIKLSRGTTYSMTIGAGGAGNGNSAYNVVAQGVAGGTTTFSTYITCNGGAGGRCVNWDGSASASMTGGAGGTYTATGYESLLAGSDGNTGPTVRGFGMNNGGESLYGGYGQGGGGYGSHYSAHPTGGKDGYVGIFFVTSI